MRRFGLRGGCLGLALLLSPWPAPYPAIAASSGAPVLERAVLVVRHGVRSPTHPPDNLAQETGASWPDWPVAPGEMTPLGAASLGIMGGALGVRYRSLVEPGCAVAVWADAGDDRTRQSGATLADSVAPGCHIVARWSEHLPDPMFDPPVPASMRSALDAALLPALARPLPAAVVAAMDRLQAVLAPRACDGDRQHCLRDDATTLRWSRTGPHLSGGLAIAGSAAEDLLLCYEQGLACPGLTPDRAADALLLGVVMPAHDEESLLLRRAPSFGKVKGSVMAMAVLDLLDPRAGETNPVPDLPPATRLLVLAGHDSNLDALSAVFGLDWHLNGQPDRTAPDTALAFERWREPDGSLLMRIRVFHQTLDEIRDRTPITLLDENGQGQPLDIGACGGVSACPISRLRALGH